MPAREDDAGDDSRARVMHRDGTMGFLYVAELSKAHDERENGGPVGSVG